MTTVLPTVEKCREGGYGTILSFDLRGHLDLADVEVFLAQLTGRPADFDDMDYEPHSCVWQPAELLPTDECEEIRDEWYANLPSWWGAMDVEHMWRFEVCESDEADHEPDEPCTCDWKIWQYESVQPGDGVEWPAPADAVAVTRLSPAPGGFNGQSCYAHPDEPATTGLPEHWWPERVVLNPERYTVVTDPTTVTETWAINRLPVLTVLSDSEGEIWQQVPVTAEGAGGLNYSVRRWVSLSNPVEGLSGTQLVENHGPLTVLRQPHAHRTLYACRECATALQRGVDEQTKVRVDEMKRLASIGLEHLWEQV